MPGVKIYYNSTVLQYIFLYNLWIVYFYKLKYNLFIRQKCFTPCNDPVWYNISYYDISSLDIVRYVTKFLFLVKIDISLYISLFLTHTHIYSFFLTFSPSHKVIHTISRLINITKHSKHNAFTKLSTLHYKVIHTISHSIEYYIITRSKIHPFSILPVLAY